MTNNGSKLVFHLLTSKLFWVGAPIIIAEIVQRGHYLSVFDEMIVPPYEKLLECDVFMDMSTITRKGFYYSLNRELKRRVDLGLKTPLMVDSPQAIINSFDKRLTHRIFSDLVPESYNLTGHNNPDKINRFRHDDFVVIKPPLGWWGENIEKLSPELAIEKFGTAKDLIVQKYIPATEGVGRIVTLNHGTDFKIICSYVRVSSSWRTGADVNYKCLLQPVTPALQNFAKTISQRCGLYLNGIDYLCHEGKLILLEVNAVPAIREPLEEFGIDVPNLIINHIERSLGRALPR